MRNTISNIKKIVSVLFFTTIVSAVYGQRPTHSTSPESTPIDLNNWFDIVVFIIFPIVIVAFYVVWRRKVRKEKQEQKNANG